MMKIYFQSIDFQVMYLFSWVSSRLSHFLKLHVKRWEKVGQSGICFYSNCLDSDLLVKTVKCVADNYM